MQENHMVLPYADDEPTSFERAAEDYDDAADMERAYENGDLGRDRNGEGDDAFELRRTLREIGLSGDLPALAKRQAE